MQMVKYVIVVTLAKATDPSASPQDRYHDLGPISGDGQGDNYFVPRMD